MSDLVPAGVPGAADARPSGAGAGGTNPMMPHLARIEEIVPETASGDVKTFRVQFLDPDVSFSHLPGQCAMVSVLGVGEAMISISSSPTRPRPLELAVKQVGRLTARLHEMEPGDVIGLRGPYGNHFPIEDMKGKDLLFIGGGIGLAPLRSLINYVLDNRADYGKIDIIYGARSPGDLCFKRELYEVWPFAPDTRVLLTVDRGDEEWKGAVALVPHFLEQVHPEPEGKIAITCGPPIMIKFTLESLKKLGFADEQIVTTLELKMQCGIGKCGRCNIGSRYVCLDGPVFTLAQLKAMPAEY